MCGPSIVPSRFIRIAGKQPNLVALRVTEVPDVKPRAIGRSEAGLPFVSSPSRQSRCMQVPHLLLAARLKSHHGTIAGRGRCAIVRRLNIEVRHRGATRIHGQDITQPLRALFQLIAQRG